VFAAGVLTFINHTGKEENERAYGVQPGARLLDLRRLSDAECAILAAVLARRTLKNDEILIEEDQVDHCLYVIVSGALEVCRRSGGDWVSLHVLKTGDLAGELGFIDGQPHSASLRSIGPSEVLILERSQFEPCWKAIQGDLRRHAHHPAHGPRHPAAHESAVHRTFQLHHQAARPLLDRGRTIRRAIAASRRAAFYFFSDQITPPKPNRFLHVAQDDLHRGQLALEHAAGSRVMAATNSRLVSCVRPSNISTWISGMGALLGGN